MPHDRDGNGVPSSMVPGGGVDDPEMNESNLYERLEGVQEVICKPIICKYVQT